MYLIGEKEFAASPPLFDKRSGCYGNGLMEAAEKPKILKKVFDNAGREHFMVLTLVHTFSLIR